MKVNQSIAPQSGSMQKATFSQIIALPTYQKMLETAIQDPKRRQRFITTIVSAVNNTPKLKECKPDSIIAAALQMEALGLTTGLGDAYLIPYNDVAQFQMGARGYVQLAMRSGQYLDIDTIEVRKGEYKGRDKLTGKPIFEFIEDDDVREGLPIVGYLAYFTLLNGFHAQEYFSKTKMLAWADRYSQSFSAEVYNKFINGEELTDKEARMVSAPWFQSFDAMSEKTVLKRLLSKKGVLSIEMVEAFKADMKDGTSDGLFEMNLVEEDSKEAPIEEPTVDPMVTPTPVVPLQGESSGSAATATSTPRRGRPPKAENTTGVRTAEPQPIDFDAFA